MTRRAALLGGLLAVTVLAPAPAIASGPAPDPPPTVTATPSAGLVDGQVITGHGLGFDERRDGYVLLVQCAAGQTRRGCHVGELDPDPMQGPGGTVDQHVRVQAVFRGEDGVEVDCRAAPGVCVLHAFTEAGTVVVDAPLSFDPSVPLEPPPTVTVTPDTGLVDGQVVHLEVDGFTPSMSVRVMLCDGPTPSARCFEGSALNEEIASDTTGHAEGEVRVRTLVNPGVRYEWSTAEAGPPFDCRVVDCHLVVTEEVAGNSDGSAALAFDPDAPLAPEAGLTASPTTGLRDGQEVSFAVTNLFAGEVVVIGQCSPDAPVRERCADEQQGRADADGNVHGTLRVYSRFDHAAVPADPPVDCFDTPCELWLWRSDDDNGPEATLPLSFAGDTAPPATPVAASPAFTG